MCGLNFGVCPSDQFCDDHERVCYRYEKNVNCGDVGQAPISGRCCPPANIKNGICTLLQTGSCVIEGDCDTGYSCCFRLHFADRAAATSGVSFLVGLKGWENSMIHVTHFSGFRLYTTYNADAAPRASL
ncbi:hypothetical protein NQZ79_g6255 [Umbelopsis isabellina]|nr:hypothetical protein NQZ79_g6255 [Umbelopsis isabellina]